MRRARTHIGAHLHKDRLQQHRAATFLSLCALSLSLSCYTQTHTCVYLLWPLLLTRFSLLSNRFHQTQSNSLLGRIKALRIRRGLRKCLLPLQCQRLHFDLIAYDKAQKLVILYMTATVVCNRREFSPCFWQFTVLATMLYNVQCWGLFLRDT